MSRLQTDILYFNNVLYFFHSLSCLFGDLKFSGSVLSSFFFADRKESVFHLTTFFTSLCSHFLSSCIALLGEWVLVQAQCHKAIISALKYVFICRN